MTKGSISKVEESVENVKVEDKKAEKKAEKKASRKPIKLDPHQEVEVENISTGTLIYISKNSGAEYIFTKPHDTDYMEIQEIKRMIASQKSFFKNQWIKILDPEVEKALHLTHYYKDTLAEEEIRELFESDADALEYAINKYSNPVKINILKVGRDMYENGELKNIDLIKVLEKKFNITLVE